MENRTMRTGTAYERRSLSGQELAGWIHMRFKYSIRPILFMARKYLEEHGMVYVYGALDLLRERCGNTLPYINDEEGKLVRDLGMMNVAIKKIVGLSRDDISKEDVSKHPDKERYLTDKQYRDRINAARPIWLDLYRGHYYVSSNGNHRIILLKHFGKGHKIRTVKARVTEYLGLETGERE